MNRVTEQEPWHLRAEWELARRDSPTRIDDDDRDGNSLTSCAR